jgi:transcription factor IIIB subunit 2
MRMGLKDFTILAAKRIYYQAFERNFIQGRSVYSVAAVCLYIACRCNKSPLMLIDFADAVQIDMFTLGHIYHQLLKPPKGLAMMVPFVDPCLFIERFCSRLEFGSKAKQVENLATRLIQTMNRAWISIGRRPNGLCGAAILLASRVLGFRRSTAQIVRVVHTCE